MLEADSRFSTNLTLAAGVVLPLLGSSMAITQLWNFGAALRDIVTEFTIAWASVFAVLRLRLAIRTEAPAFVKAFYWLSIAVCALLLTIVTVHVARLLG